MPGWKLVVMVIVLFGMLALLGGILSAAPPQQESACVITFPSDGAVLSGQVQILGSATSADFVYYGIFYAPGPNPTAESLWTNMLGTYPTQPVVNGVLATWDTTALTGEGQPAVPNGLYHLTIVCWHQGSGVVDQDFVTNLTVNNIPATATPTPQEEETPPPTSSADTPTPVPIEQPPTVTPAPTPTREPGATPAVGGEEEGDSRFQINLGRLRSAFLDGAKLTILFFILWGLYVLTKAIVRYLLHHRGFHVPFDLPWRKR